jgi:hypothetical protein
MTLPSGTVTFLSMDIEESIKLAQEYPDEKLALLAWHDELFGLYKWYHRSMTTATAQSFANIAFTIYWGNHDNRAYTPMNGLVSISPPIHVSQ